MIARFDADHVDRAEELQARVTRAIEMYAVRSKDPIGASLGTERNVKR